jgi:hypothetical protein
MEMRYFLLIHDKERERWLTLYLSNLHKKELPTYDYFLLLNEIWDFDKKIYIFSIYVLYKSNIQGITTNRIWAAQHLYCFFLLLLVMLIVKGYVYLV